MQQENWAKIADIYARIVELPEEQREGELARLGLGADDETALRRLLVINTRQTGFLATGGAIGHDLDHLGAGDVVGSWRVLEMIGAGGMGEVYRVERADGHYSQIAALKRITLSDKAAFERFERERQILAQLEHPNIGRLIDGGIDDKGAPFLVMEFIEGQTLSDYVADRKLTREQILQLYLKVCGALSHAHGRLVLHRDLKPTNILVMANGEVKIIDFGVAGLIDEAEADLKSPMTFLYAAPEQYEGRRASVETDVFSLGVVLWELLSEERLFRKGPDLSLNLTGLPRDLRMIVQKATEADPTNRYNTVDAFADDLRRYLSRDPVAARSGGIGYRINRLISKYPSVSFLAACLVAALIVGVVGTTSMMLRAQQALRERNLAFVQSQTSAAQAQAARNTFRTIIARASDAAGDTEKTLPEIIGDEIDRLAPQFVENPEQVGASLFALAQLNEQRGDLALTLRALQPQADHPEILTSVSAPSLMRHGVFSIYSGEIDGAEASLKRAIALMSEAPDLHADDLLLARGYLAEITGDTEAMEEVVTDVIARSETLDLSSDAARNKFAELIEASSYWAIILDDRPRTIAMLEKALDVNRQIKGPKSIKDSTFLNNLIGQYQRAGELARAQALNDELVDLLTASVGPSVDLGLAWRMRGTLLSDTGDQAGAISAFGKAADLFRAYDVEDSDILFYTELDIARCMARNGEIERAAERFERLRVENEALLASLPVAAGTFHLKRGEARLYAGDTDAGRKDLNQALKIFDEDGSRPDLIRIAQEKLDQL